MDHVDSESDDENASAAKAPRFEDRAVKGGVSFDAVASQVVDSIHERRKQDQLNKSQSGDKLPTAIKK